MTVEVTLVNRDAFHCIRVRNHKADLTPVRRCDAYLIRRSEHPAERLGDWFDPVIGEAEAAPPATSTVLTFTAADSGPMLTHPTAIPAQTLRAECCRCEPFLH